MNGTIADYLHDGAGNAITGRELCALLGLHPRDVSKAIENARRAGIPICATTGRRPGYYLAATQDEMTRYCDGLRRRAGEISKTRRACLRTISDLPDLPTSELPEPAQLPAADLPEGAELPAGELPEIPDFSDLCGGLDHV